MSLTMHTDDKVDDQSNDSASSSDSGVITDDKFMPDSPKCNVDITTSINCDPSDRDFHDTSIDIENILNLAKNITSTKKSPPRSKKCSASPTFSIRSTNISITSIQSDAVSSVIDSDSDAFEDSNGNYTIRKLGKQTSTTGRTSIDFPNIAGGDGMVLLQQQVNGEEPCIGALAPQASTSIGCATPQVGSMAFTNSTDITIGQKNFYQGPVTIQQFLIENRKRDDGPIHGADNPAFENASSPEVPRRPQHNDDTPGMREEPAQPYKFIFNRKAALITAAIIILTIALGVIFVTASSMLSSKSKRYWDDEETRKNIPANTTIGSDNIGGGKILRLIARDEWLATPPNGAMDKLVLPVHRVVIAHTATENCSSQAMCTYRTRMIQQFHMQSRGYSDISYNYLIGGDGCVYEGRGWDLQGAHTKGYNSDSLGIAFIGTFTLMTPPEKQLNAAKLIIDEGVRLKKLVPNYKLFGARQLVGSESPGLALFNIIKKWPHWSSSLTPDGNT